MAGRGGRGRGRGRGRTNGRGRGQSGNQGPKQTTLFSSNSKSNSSNKDKGPESNSRKSAQAQTKDGDNVRQNVNNKDPSQGAKEKQAESEVDNGHASDSEDEEQKDEYEEEDDLNTVNSDQTSKRGQSQQKKKVLPPLVRYQLMIKLDSGNKDSPIDFEEGDEEKSPAQKVRDILATFYSQMRKYDSKARLITWRTKPDFSQLGDNFPTDIAQIAMYFNGYRSNIKADKRMYFRISIHTPNSQSKLSQILSSWCRIFGYSITKCVIQAENSTCIGWLCYSSKFTDTEPLRKRLVSQSDFEWGFKLISVDDKQTSLPWNERLKAIGVYVPTEFRDIGLMVIGEELEPDFNDPINIPDFTDKFLFIEPQWTTKGNKSKDLYYKDILNRHDNHMDALRAEVSYGIHVDLDREFQCYENFGVSLRDIVLDLTVSDANNEFHGDRLFHSIDYVSDSSNLWIENKNGPGGSCVVFTYYNEVANEADTMIRGLGKFIVHQHGKEIAARMFTANHFRANRGYRWDDDLKRFSTPNIRRMKSNLKKDNNLNAIHKLQRIRKAKETAKKEEEELKRNKANAIEGAMLIVTPEDEQTDKDNNPPNNSTSPPTPVPHDASPKAPSDVPPETPPTTPDNEPSLPSDTSKQIRREQMKQLREGARDPDLLSISNSSTERNNPKNIYTNDDASVASSLTTNTNNSAESFSSILSGTTVHSNNVSLSHTANFSVNLKMIDDLVNADNNVSDKELRRQVKAMQAHKFNEAVVNAENLVEKYIIARKNIQGESSPESKQYDERNDTDTVMEDDKHEEEYDNSLNSPEEKYDLSLNSPDEKESPQNEIQCNNEKSSKIDSPVSDKESPSIAYSKDEKDGIKDSPIPSSPLSDDNEEAQETPSISSPSNASNVPSPYSLKDTETANEKNVNSPSAPVDNIDNNLTEFPELPGIKNHVTPQRSTTPEGKETYNNSWSYIAKKGLEESSPSSTREKEPFSKNSIETQKNTTSDDDPKISQLPTPVKLDNLSNDNNKPINKSKSKSKAKTPKTQRKSARLQNNNAPSGYNTGKTK